jgi:tRNA-dihydrouridine synthase A
LSDIDELIYGERPNTISRIEVLEQYMVYMQSELDKGLPLKILAQHIFGLFNGLPGARAWRRYLSENIYAKNAGVEVINAAVKSVTEFEKVAIAS